MSILLSEFRNFSGNTLKGHAQSLSPSYDPNTCLRPRVGVIRTTLHRTSLHSLMTSRNGGADSDNAAMMLEFRALQERQNQIARQLGVSDMSALPATQAQEPQVLPFPSTQPAQTANYFGSSQQAPPVSQAPFNTFSALQSPAPITAMSYQPQRRLPNPNFTFPPVVLPHAGPSDVRRQVNNERVASSSRNGGARAARGTATAPHGRSRGVARQAPRLVTGPRAVHDLLVTQPNHTFTIPVRVMVHLKKDVCHFSKFLIMCLTRFTVYRRSGCQSGLHRLPQPHRLVHRPSECPVSQLRPGYRHDHTGLHLHTRRPG